MRPGVIEAPPSYVGSCGSFSNPVRIRCRSVVVLLSSYRDAAIVPLPRRVTAVLPRRRHRRAASSMSFCAAVVPLRCRRPTATPPSFCRGACDASMCSRRLRCWHVSSATAFRQIVRVDNARHSGYSLCNLSIACQNAWFFPSPPKCFRLFSSSSHSSLLSVRYLGRTAEKMIRRCLVREKALKPCSSGRGRLVGSPGERRSFSIENRRKGARKPQKEGDTICKTGKRQRRGIDHPQNAERMRRVFFGPFL